MIRTITFDEMPGSLPVLDVRAPAEFMHGHIPGAQNLPLFSDEERVRVGTTYKREGRAAAILLGFDLTGPKWSAFVREALILAPEKKIVLHCWRGGMRSAAMAWALDMSGFEIYLLEGGYKHYRQWVARQMERSYSLWVIGGMTGSGKTAILHELREAGEQVIDLEDLAQHQGSAYGSLNRLIQPTQEQFENNLAEVLSSIDPDKKTWIEDESQNIGKCQLTQTFWHQLRNAPLFDLQVPVEERVVSLVKEYGCLDKDFLVECTVRIGKRLGPEQMKDAIAAICEDRMEEFIRLVLVYYDKTYRKGLITREASQIVPIPVSVADPLLNARSLLKAAQRRTEIPI
jgi:tRNA 2-selenouridine synthase